MHQRMDRKKPSTESMRTKKRQNTCWVEWASSGNSPLRTEMIRQEGLMLSDSLWQKGWLREQGLMLPRELEKALYLFSWKGLPQEVAAFLR